jgi:phenylacetic acid degradation operon negative regulatory protein
VVAWRGGWIAAYTGGLSRGDRRAHRRRRRAFDFLGFRELDPGLWIRPDNLRGGVGESRRQLRALGLEEYAPVGALTDLDGVTERRARALWDVKALVEGYRATCHALEESERRLAELPPERAIVETFLLGGRAIRQLAFDPLLPEPILPTAERSTLVKALRRYDRLGRQCWRPFMAAHRATHLRSPVNLRGASATAEHPAIIGSQG